MTIRDNDPVSRHRLFHAMVLMGGSLALRCGGEAATNGGSSGTGGVANTGGASTTTGGNPSGGNPSGGNPSGGNPSGGNPSGGSTGGSITIIPATGGQPAVLDCPPTQWSCTDFPTCYSPGFRVPENCKCDTSRPINSAACATGQTLVCLDGRSDSTGQQFSEPTGFECACVADQINCGMACDAIFPNTGNCRQLADATTGLREILCGCAVIVLR